MRKEIFDIPIDWITNDELERKLKLFVVSQKPHQLTTVNAEFLVLSQHNETFRHILQTSDLSLPDGTSLVIAQSLDDKKYASSLQRAVAFVSLGLRHLLAPSSFAYKRITGVDLTHCLLQLGAEEHWKFFLLGAGPDVAKKTGAVWQQAYPGIEIVGASDANPDNESILSAIKAANPDILLVAYGAPKQDLFIDQHKETLKVPIMVGIGGTFDYAVGNIYRAPAWIRVIGLEWLVRLIQQPRRFKRIWRSTVVFAWSLISKPSGKSPK